MKKKMQNYFFNIFSKNNAISIILEYKYYISK